VIFAEHIINQGQSCLVILNTIADTKSLYERITCEVMDIRIILLNTHFIPEDRIKKSKQLKTIGIRKTNYLISTQLIEAA
jgi:CRISPR-associated endonuclease/helicase Cas3